MAIFKKVLCTAPGCNYWRTKLDVVKKDGDGKVIRDEKGRPVKEEKATCPTCGSAVKLAPTYTIQYYVGSGDNREKKTQTTTFTKPGNAKAALAVIQSGVSVAAFAAMPCGDTDFDVYAREFEALHAAQIKDKKREKCIINHLIKFFGSKPLNSFLLKDLEAYISHRMQQFAFDRTQRKKKNGQSYQQNKPSRKVRASTVGRELSVLRMILNHAIRNKKLHYSHVTDNPFFEFKMPVSRMIIPLWSMSDIERLFAGLTVSLRPLFEFIAETGCRIEEAMSLKASQVNREKRTAILVSTKSDVAKDTHTVLHLSYEAMEIILAQPENNEYVFTNPKTKTRYKNPRTSFHRVAKKEGFIYHDGSLIRTHDLRHIFLTALAEGGANDAALMKISRHRDERSLRRYIHVRDEMTQDAFKNINRS